MGLAILCAGMLFLVVTISIEDILLTAVALEFVLNVDELLFTSLAPMKTRKMILMLKPIRLNRSRAWHGLDLHLPFASLWVLGCLSGLLFNYMVPEMNKMRDAKA